MGSKVKGSSVLQSISKEMASLWKAPSKGVLILIQRGVLIFSVHRYACMHAKSLQSCPTLWTVACQAPLSMGILQARYWSGLPFPSPGHLLNLGIEPASLALDSLPLSHQGSPVQCLVYNDKFKYSGLSRDLKKK